jgi:hypothetical protein
MHVGGAHGHDREPFFFQKPNVFNCGTNGLWGGGAWGSSQLKDRSRPTSWQCAFVLTR